MKRVLLSFHYNRVRFPQFQVKGRYSTKTAAKVSQKIAEYTQKVIQHSFTEPVENAEKVLHNSINFFKDTSMGETILQQTLLKGLFPRLSYKRSVIAREIKPHISEKIEVAAQNNKSDCRLIGEIITSSRLAESASIIKKIIMNYEDPTRNTTIKSSSGNVNDDITVELSIENKSYSFTSDIKGGNNANNPFSGVVSSVPYNVTEENYSVINNKIISLPHVQTVRISHFKLMAETYKSSPIIREVSTQLEYINTLPIDIIQKNILIQERIFRAISTGLNIGTPSFYVGYIVPDSITSSQEFFRKLEPYLNSSIFNDKKSFNIFMRQALVAYNENIAEIAKANKQLFKESRLSEIANDIFN